MQSIVLLIVLLCFQVELDWFTEPAAVLRFCRSKWPYVEVCRAISSYSTRKSAIYIPRTLETFGGRAEEPLGTLSLRNNTIEARSQVDCRVMLPSLANVCKTQSYLFKWGPLQCDVNRRKLPGDFLKSNCSGKLAKQVVSATDIVVPRLLPEDERAWERDPQSINPWNKGSYWAVIMRTENKDPSNLFTTFFRFVFFVAIRSSWSGKELIRKCGEKELAIHS